MKTSINVAFIYATTSAIMYLPFRVFLVNHIYDDIGPDLGVDQLDVELLLNFER